MLLCELSGTAPFQVSWRKNAKRLSTDHKFRTVLQGSMVSLHIQSFEAADGGEYECIVSNEVGSVASKAVVQQRGNDDIEYKQNHSLKKYSVAIAVEALLASNIRAISYFRAAHLRQEDRERHGSVGQYGQASGDPERLRPHRYQMVEGL